MFLFSFALLLVTCSASDKPSILPASIFSNLPSGQPAMDRSEDSPAASNLNQLVRHIVVNYSTTLGTKGTFEIDFSPPVTQAAAILQILEEAEESFVLVSDAKVVLDDTGATVICNGFGNSSEDGAERAKAEERSARLTRWGFSFGFGW